MKRNFLFILLFMIVGSVAAQSDSELNNLLKDININAKADLKLFKKDLSVEFNIAEGKIDNLMLNYNMQPADVFMTLQVAQQTSKTPEQVADVYKVNKGKGWGVIAKEMGIKPGSPEFHALKDKAKGKNNKMKEKKGKGNKNGKGKGNGKK